jgi:hypothetical protein
MTKFTVVWHQKAQDELAILWTDSADRAAVANAADAIDHYLASDADDKGTAIVDVIRRLTIPPLQVLFAVSEPDRMVRVLRTPKSKS